MRVIKCPHCGQLTDGTGMVGDVVEFHKKFNIDYDGPPRFLPDDLQEFRSSTIQEELDEYLHAVESKDPEEIFDALIDLMYFALGTVRLHGFSMERGWMKVHQANMMKELASVLNPGKRDFPDDIVKPPGWVKPDLSKEVYPLERPRTLGKETK